ncbi:hypothetical protein TRVA0_005S02058 [Trichomonascus vanleenenianus]|uniref:uncharacterized protein n=1 Tax=Trichomonascus vanleenenianus TaxID=2268995 RepID=UPI003ECB533A
MSYKVKVTGLSEKVTESEIVDFFSFCGTVSAVSIEQRPEGRQAFVGFNKPAAVKTALLLSESELGGSKVTITVDDETLAATEAAAGVESPPDREPEEGEKLLDTDIGQEYKPRSAIVAEYLSHGYVLGDKVVAQALEFDKKHGIYNRFANFLSDVDNRYHVVDKANATDQAYGIRDNLSKGQERLSRYFEGALNTERGRKVRDYYAELVKEASDVHNEARRLADLKQQDAAQPSGEAAEQTHASEKN